MVVWRKFGDMQKRSFTGFVIKTGGSTAATVYVSCLISGREPIHLDGGGIVADCASDLSRRRRLKR
jgi:hypothetical protein